MEVVVMGGRMVVVSFLCSVFLLLSEDYFFVVKRK